MASSPLRLALGLSACGGIVGAGNAGNVETAENGPVEGELVISNWPGYVDPGKDNSLAQFTDRTGVEIEYIEDINDNAAFFGKVQPLLDQGESGDRSIMVVTDWMAKQMYDLGYLQEVDHDDLPTVFENIRPGIRSSELDPGAQVRHPVAERYDRDLGGHQGGARHHLDQRPLRPQVQGPRDDAHRDARHRAAGDEGRRRRPQPTATTEEWMAAVDKIQAAVDDGQIRRFTGNDYTEDITSGNAVASIGWSGDGYLISNPDAEWRMPDEGCISGRTTW